MATTYDKASLVMIPSGYKDDKLYSIKPTDGSGDFTFSRDGAGASPATRVNASGLIEKGRTNELLQSNSFDTTWLNAASTETGGQAGYDGTNDAWLLEKTGATGHIYQTLSSSGVLTLSVYAKAGSRDWMRVIATGGSSTPSTWFDLANGVVGTADFFTIDSNIESVGGGWYRCSITFEVGSINGVRFYPAEGNNDISGTSGNIYIQDSQLESGLVATDYIETTTAAVSAGLLGDMPRLDYSGGATCPSLLLEPSRTNYLPESEYIAGWGGANTAVVTNAAISPEGVQNASSVTFSAGGYWYKSITRSYSAGQSFTWSIYADTQDQVTRWGGSTPAGTDTLSVVDAGNGWYRQTLTRVVSGSGTANFQPLMDSVYVGVGTTFYVYGAQFEEGSYPTSYIPTYGSASTRGADSCSKTGISSLIGQTEGTLFFECANKALVNQARYFILSDGGFNNRIDIYQYSDTQLGVYVAASGSAQVAGQYVTLPSSGSFKFALAYANNDYVWYLNGSQIGTDTTGSVPSLDTALFALDAAGNTLGGAGNSPFKQALLFKTRLTNAELAALTTL